MKCASPLSIACALALITSGSSTPSDEWENFTAAVIFKRNDPASVNAKAAVQAAFCERFGVSPCEPATGEEGATTTGVHLLRDFDIFLPRENVTNVIVWLQQHRLARVHGAAGGADLDVMLFPNTAGADGVTKYAVHVGHKTPFNTNALAARLQPDDDDAAERGRRRALALAPAASSATARSDDDDDDDAVPSDEIFTACSSDATCYEPYAPNTTCTGDEDVASMHFHFYYTANDASAVDASNAFINATTDKFGLVLDVCADNNGREQPHDATCWLSGPGGSGPISRPSATDFQIGGSFVYPTFSPRAFDSYTWLLRHPLLMRHAIATAGTRPSRSTRRATTSSTCSRGRWR